MYVITDKYYLFNHLCGITLNRDLRRLHAERSPDDRFLWGGRQFSRTELCQNAHDPQARTLPSSRDNGPAFKRLRFQVPPWTKPSLFADRPRFARVPHEIRWDSLYAARMARVVTGSKQ